MIVREETVGDHAAIHEVVAQAFGRDDEAALVAVLRRDGALVVSLVAEIGGIVVGHVALSRLRSPERALALAPLAVAPARQRQGVGADLVRHAIWQCRRSGEHIMFVLGEPAYYSRFGFSAAAAAPYPCPYAGPHFMALQLSDLLPRPAAVIYAPAFDPLG